MTRKKNIPSISYVILFFVGVVCFVISFHFKASSAWIWIRDITINLGAGIIVVMLTLREKQFAERVKKHFKEKGVLTDQQESILEGIYREKIWMRKTIFQHQNPYNQILSRNNGNL